MPLNILWNIHFFFFERAKQAQPWASNAADINIFNYVIQHHSVISEQHLTTRETFSDSRGTQHRLLNKTAVMQSNTDDGKTTASVIIKKKITKRKTLVDFKPPPSVLTVNISSISICHCVFICPDSSGPLDTNLQSFSDSPTQFAVMDAHITDRGQHNPGWFSE